MSGIITGLLSLVLTLYSCTLFGQKSGQTDFELGVSGGVAWYNGDMNTHTMFGRDYMHPAYGISLRRNLNQRFAFRTQAIMSTLSADDALSSSNFQRNRNLNFTTPLYELATTIEFNYLPFDALVDKHWFSPYTFIGISGFYFNPTTIVEGSIFELQPLATEGKLYNRIGIAIPFGLGFKMAITDRLLFSTEWGMRRTFTDYIDDVSARYPVAGELGGLAEDLSDRSLVQSGPDGSNWGTQRGSTVTKDWFSVVSATLSVRLGPKKGSCKHLKI